MFDRDLMKRANDRPLQKAPNVLYGVGIDVATGVLADGVVDRLMEGIFVPDTPVRPPVVSVDGFGIVRHGFIGERMESLAAPVWNYLENDFAVSFDGSNDDGLVAFIPTALASDFATNERLVDFNDALEFNGRGIFNSGSDPVAEIPSRAVSNPEGPLHLFGRHAFLGFHHQVSGQEPFGQGQVAVMENGSGSDGEPAISVSAVQLIAGADS